MASKKNPRKQIDLQKSDESEQSKTHIGSTIMEESKQKVIGAIPRKESDREKSLKTIETSRKGKPENIDRYETSKTNKNPDNREKSENGKERKGQRKATKYEIEKTKKLKTNQYSQINSQPSISFRLQYVSDVSVEYTEDEYAEQSKNGRENDNYLSHITDSESNRYEEEHRVKKDHDRYYKHDKYGSNNVIKKMKKHRRHKKRKRKSRRKSKRYTTEIDREDSSSNSSKSTPSNRSNDKMTEMKSNVKFLHKFINYFANNIDETSSNLPNRSKGKFIDSDNDKNDTNKKLPKKQKNEQTTRFKELRELEARRISRNIDDLTDDSDNSTIDYSDLFMDGHETVQQAKEHRTELNDDKNRPERTSKDQTNMPLCILVDSSDDADDDNKDLDQNTKKETDNKNFAEETSVIRTINISSDEDEDDNHRIQKTNNKITESTSNNTIINLDDDVLKPNTIETDSVTVIKNEIKADNNNEVENFINPLHIERNEQFLAKLNLEENDLYQNNSSTSSAPLQLFINENNSTTTTEIFKPENNTIISGENVLFYRRPKVNKNSTSPGQKVSEPNLKPDILTKEPLVNSRNIHIDENPIYRYLEAQNLKKLHEIRLNLENIMGITIQPVLSKCNSPMNEIGNDPQVVCTEKESCISDSGIISFNESIQTGRVLPFHSPQYLSPALPLALMPVVQFLPVQPPYSTSPRLANINYPNQMQTQAHVPSPNLSYINQHANGQPPTIVPHEQTTCLKELRELETHRLSRNIDELTDGSDNSNILTINISSDEDEDDNDAIQKTNNEITDTISNNTIINVDNNDVLKSNTFKTESVTVIKNKIKNDNNNQVEGSSPENVINPLHIERNEQFPAKLNLEQNELYQNNSSTSSPPLQMVNEHNSTTTTKIFKEENTKEPSNKTKSKEVVNQNQLDIESNSQMQGQGTDDADEKNITGETSVIRTINISSDEDEDNNDRIQKTNNEITESTSNNTIINLDDDVLKSKTIETESVTVLKNKIKSDNNQVEGSSQENVINPLHVERNEQFPARFEENDLYQKNSSTSSPHLQLVINEHNSTTTTEIFKEENTKEPNKTKSKEVVNQNQQDIESNSQMQGQGIDDADEKNITGETSVICTINISRDEDEDDNDRIQKTNNEITESTSNNTIINIDYDVLKSNTTETDSVTVIKNKIRNGNNQVEGSSQENVINPLHVERNEQFLARFEENDLYQKNSSTSSPHLQLVINEHNSITATEIFKEENTKEPSNKTKSKEVVNQNQQDIESNSQMQGQGIDDADEENITGETSVICTINISRDEDEDDNDRIQKTNNEITESTSNNAIINIDYYVLKSNTTETDSVTVIKNKIRNGNNQVEGSSQENVINPLHIERNEQFPARFEENDLYQKNSSTSSPHLQLVINEHNSTTTTEIFKEENTKEPSDKIKSKEVVNLNQPDIESNFQIQSQGSATDNNVNLANISPRSDEKPDSNNQKEIVAEKDNHEDKKTAFEQVEKKENETKSSPSTSNKKKLSSASQANSQKDAILSPSSSKSSPTGGKRKTELNQDSNDYFIGDGILLANGIRKSTVINPDILTNENRITTPKVPNSLKRKSKQLNPDLQCKLSFSYDSSDDDDFQLMSHNSRFVNYIQEEKQMAEESIANIRAYINNELKYDDSDYDDGELTDDFENVVQRKKPKIDENHISNTDLTVLNKCSVSLVRVDPNLIEQYERHDDYSSVSSYSDSKNIQSNRPGRKPRIYPKNTDITQHCRSELVAKCTICLQKRMNIVQHYVNMHENKEVYVARLSNKDIDRLERKPFTAKTIAQLNPDEPRPGYSAKCIFCKKHFNNSLKLWYEHFTEHTGEYSYRCTECGQRKFSMTELIHYCGSDKEHGYPVIRVYRFDLDIEEILAYSCFLCNYVQLHKENVKKHLKMEHGLTSLDCERNVRELVLLKIPKEQIVEIVNKPIIIQSEQILQSVQTINDMTESGRYDVDAYYNDDYNDDQIYEIIDRNFDESTASAILTVDKFVDDLSFIKPDIAFVDGDRRNVERNQSNVAKDIEPNMSLINYLLDTEEEYSDQTLIDILTSTCTTTNNSSYQNSASCLNNLTGILESSFSSESNSLGNNDQDIPSKESTNTTESSKIRNRDALANLIPSQQLTKTTLARNVLNVIEILKPWLNKTISKKSEEICIKCITENNLCSFYKCMGDDCIFATYSVQKFEQHISDHDLQKDAENMLNRSWCECCYCDELFDGLSILSSHINDKHSSSIFQCSMCFYRCSSAYGVIFHQKKFHPTIKTKEQKQLIYICDGISQSLESMKEMIIRLRETNVQPFICEICKAPYYVKQPCIDHIRREHPQCDASILDKLPEYSCVYCPHQVLTKEEIKEHLVNNHPDMPFCACRRTIKEGFTYENCCYADVSCTYLIRFDKPVDKILLKKVEHVQSNGATKNNDVNLLYDIASTSDEDEQSKINQEFSNLIEASTGNTKRFQCKNGQNFENRKTVEEHRIKCLTYNNDDGKEQLTENDCHFNLFNNMNKTPVNTNIKRAVSLTNLNLLQSPTKKLKMPSSNEVKRMPILLSEVTEDSSVSRNILPILQIKEQILNDKKQNIKKQRRRRPRMRIVRLNEILDPEWLPSNARQQKKNK